jgi:hypothetical protein
VGSDKEIPQPPQPPDVERELQFYPWQIAGIVLIALVPILALFNVFGEAFETTSAASAELEINVLYPARYTYSMINSVEVSVHNLSAQSIPTVTVRIDRSYLDSFSHVNITPGPKTITEDAYEVELTDLTAGEVRRVVAEIQGDKYGMHEAFITAVPEGAGPVEVSITTIVFP